MTPVSMKQTEVKLDHGHSIFIL